MSLERQPEQHGEQGDYPGRERRRVPRTLTPLTGVPAIRADDRLQFPLSQRELEDLVRAALQEDGAFNDVTTLATVVSTRRSRGTLVARGDGVVAGVPLAVSAFRILDPKTTIRIEGEDGHRITKGQPVLFLSGHARPLLSAERVAVNFMMRLSGIATLTRRYVDAIAGTGAKILDTRKTTPGWRRLEKYAVRCGGGHNHRMDLASAVLIKDNHLSAVDGSVAEAVRRARTHAPQDAKVEVECDNMDQVHAALDAGVDIILLDNMPNAVMAEAVKLARGKAILEASGGINLDNVRSVAETGVDWISVGKLTHSAPSLDMALDFD
jgi:nicotinate-nucleotide pyrophosphorylase (carboxylating)